MTMSSRLIGVTIAAALAAGSVWADSGSVDKGSALQFDGRGFASEQELLSVIGDVATKLGDRHYRVVQNGKVFEFAFGREALAAAIDSTAVALQRERELVEKKFSDAAVQRTTELDRALSRLLNMQADKSASGIFGCVVGSHGKSYEYSLDAQLVGGHSVAWGSASIRVSPGIYGFGPQIPGPWGQRFAQAYASASVPMYNWHSSSFDYNEVGTWAAPQLIVTANAYTDACPGWGCSGWYAYGFAGVMECDSQWQFYSASSW